MLFKSSEWRTVAGIVGVCVVLLIAGYFLAGKNIANNPFRVAVIFIPVTLVWLVVVGLWMQSPLSIWK